MHSISSNYILPPFLWHFSEFSIVLHENCTIGKLTFSSQKVKFNLLQLHPPPFLWYLSEFSIIFHENCTIGKLTFFFSKSCIQSPPITSSPHFCGISASFQLFFMKIAPLESLHFPLKKLHSISSNYILPPFLLSQ